MEDQGRPAYESDASLRGWIDPDDRLWRHPSEVATAAGRSTESPLIGIRHPKVMILIGAAATLAAIAWAMVLISPASDQPPATPASDNAAEIPQTTLVAKSQQVPVPAEAASRAVVQLRADTSNGIVPLVGVAVAEGGLVATTAEGLSGLHSLWMVGAGGRQLRASVLGYDSASDVALVDATLTNGSGDMTLSLTAVAGGTMSLHCTAGSVTSVAAMIGSGPAQGMPDITSVSTTAGQEAGDPLLNQEGAVIGILYQAGPTSTFLPTQLVLGVADDLRSAGRVSHGWLGMAGTDVPGSGGARVASFMPGSPAAKVLQPGDVIVGLGTVPIRSMADLRGRLYVLAPGSNVELSVLEGTTVHQVDVTLGASP